MRLLFGMYKDGTSLVREGYRSHVTSNRSYSIIESFHSKSAYRIFQLFSSLSTQTINKTPQKYYLWQNNAATRIDYIRRRLWLRQATNVVEPSSCLCGSKWNEKIIFQTIVKIKFMARSPESSYGAFILQFRLQLCMRKHRKFRYNVHKTEKWLRQRTKSCKIFTFTLQPFKSRALVLASANIIQI